LRFQHETALQPLLRLISWDWTSPYELCTLFIYSLLLVSCQLQTCVSDIKCKSTPVTGRVGP
jgi:hypothetical protein